MLAERSCSLPLDPTNHLQDELVLIRSSVSLLGEVDMEAFWAFGAVTVGRSLRCDGCGIVDHLRYAIEVGFTDVREDIFVVMEDFERLLHDPEGEVCMCRVPCQVNEV